MSGRWAPYIDREQCVTTKRNWHHDVNNTACKQHSYARHRSPGVLYHHSLEWDQDWWHHLANVNKPTERGLPCLVPVNRAAVLVEVCNKETLWSPGCRQSVGVQRRRTRVHQLGNGTVATELIHLLCKQRSTVSATWRHTFCTQRRYPGPIILGQWPNLQLS